MLDVLHLHAVLFVAGRVVASGCVETRVTLARRVRQLRAGDSVGSWTAERELSLFESLQ